MPRGWLPASSSRQASLTRGHWQRGLRTARHAQIVRTGRPLLLASRRAAACSRAYHWLPCSRVAAGAAAYKVRIWARCGHCRAGLITLTYLLSFLIWFWDFWGIEPGGERRRFFVGKVLAFRLGFCERE